MYIKVDIKSVVKSKGVKQMSAREIFFIVLPTILFVCSFV